MREASSPSYFNLYERDLVGRYLDMMLSDPALGVRQSLFDSHNCQFFNILLGPEDIGVISPYSAQNKKLRELPTVGMHAAELKTGTVEAFQAQVSQSPAGTRY
jgi:helicase MOV-10